MILATHAIVGAAMASLVPSNPILGILAAVGSHYILDAIPHSEYNVHSPSVDPSFGAPIRIDRRFILDIVTIGADLSVGTILSFLFFAPSAPTLVVLLGVCGGVFPDMLQFAYAHFRHEPLITLQRLHRFVHAKQKSERSIFFVLGTQTSFVVLIVLLIQSFLIHGFSLQDFF